MRSRRDEVRVFHVYLTSRCVNVLALAHTQALSLGSLTCGQYNGCVTLMLQKLSEHILDCYERAAECAEQAAQASDEIRKTDFINMQRSWTHLARSCEYMGELERFLLNAYRDKIQGVGSTSDRER
jgi:hypothetical protein